MAICILDQEGCVGLYRILGMKITKLKDWCTFTGRDEGEGHDVVVETWVSKHALFLQYEVALLANDIKYFQETCNKKCLPEKAIY